MKVFIPRFLGAAGFFGVLMIDGTLGYMRLEGRSFADARYMTATTLTAVGYDEVHPLSQAGRNLTMALLVGGITGMGIWFALLTSLIVEADLANLLWRRRGQDGPGDSWPASARTWSTSTSASRPETSIRS